MTDYKIKKVPTNKQNIKQPKGVHNNIIPSLPASFLIIGKSGSGKSTILYNLLTNKNLLGDYFNYIFVFSPVKTDDILLKLKLPKENYISSFDEKFVEHIIRKIENKIKCKGGLGRCANETKVLFIFDDILSEQKFLKSTTMKKIASANRHYNISWIINSQYYKAIPPIVRTNASAIILFPSSMSELEKVAEENTEPNQTKKEFIEIAQRATNKPYSFLYINKRAGVGSRLRSGFEEVLY